MLRAAQRWLLAVSQQIASISGLRRMVSAVRVESDALAARSG